MVVPVGLEPTSFRLGGERSSIELRNHNKIVSLFQIIILWKVL